LAKLLPALLLPLFWRELGAPDHRWYDPRPRRALLWFPLLSGAAYLPFARAGHRLLTGLGAYVQHWRFNDALFAAISSALGGESALPLAKGVSAVLLLLAALWSLRCHTDPCQSAFFTLGAYLLLSPTLHPWYLLWVLPFLALFPRPAWILLSGLVFLAYQVLIGYSKSGVWVERAWVRWAEYAPFYLLLALEAVYRHRRDS
jgi:hypothetical protein